MDVIDGMLEIDGHPVGRLFVPLPARCVAAHLPHPQIQLRLFLCQLIQSERQ